MPFTCYVAVDQWNLDQQDGVPARCDVVVNYGLADTATGLGVTSDHPWDQGVVRFWIQAGTTASMRAAMESNIQALEPTKPGLTFVWIEDCCPHPGAGGVRMEVPARRP